MQDGRDALALLPSRHQPFEAFLCTKVRGARFENHLVVVDGIGRTAEAGFENGCELVREIDGVLPLGLVEVPSQQLGQLRPTVESGVQTLKRASRRRVTRVELERLLVTGDRLFGRVENLLEKEAELQQQVELGSRVGGCLDATLIERAQVVPILVLGVELLQRSEGGVVQGLVAKHTSVEASGRVG